MKITVWNPETKQYDLRDLDPRNPNDQYIIDLQGATQNEPMFSRYEKDAENLWVLQTTFIRAKTEQRESELEANKETVIDYFCEVLSKCTEGILWNRESIKYEESDNRYDLWLMLTPDIWDENSWQRRTQFFYDFGLELRGFDHTKCNYDEFDASDDTLEKSKSREEKWLKDNQFHISGVREAPGYGFGKGDAYASLTSLFVHEQYYEGRYIDFPLRHHGTSLECMEWIKGRQSVIRQNDFEVHQIDVTNREELEAKCQHYRDDGFMIASFGKFALAIKVNQRKEREKV